MSKPIFGPQSDQLSMIEWRKVKQDMRFVFSTGIPFTVMTDPFHWDNRRWLVIDTEGVRDVVYAGTCDQKGIRPADESTALALGREKPKPMWGLESREMVPEEISSLKTGDRVHCRVFGVGKWVGVDPRDNTFGVIRFDKEWRGKVLLTSSFGCFHPADEECARACGRIE